MPGLPARHRRAVVGVLVLVALTAAALAWTRLTGDSPGDPAAAPRTPSTSPSSAPADPETTEIPRHLRRWLEPGTPLPTPATGVTVVDEVDDPVGLGRGSLGLSLQNGTARRWVLAVVRDGELLTFSDVPRISSWLTFDQWLADLVDQERGGRGTVLADVRRDGTMVPVAPGAVILDQAVDHDNLMGAFRESRDSVFAVALVRWQQHRWWVWAERYDGPHRTQTVAESRTGVRARTAEQFLTRMGEAGRRP